MNQELNMKKLTELTETKFRTTYKKDAYGNRIRGKEEYVGKIRLKTIKAGPRFGHFFIDSICFQIVLMLFQFILGLYAIALNDSPFGLTLALFTSIISLLLYPFLYFMCEYLWQETPGKLLTKSIVVDEYGNKPTVRQIILRSLVRLVPFEGLSCLNTHSYGWHDRWSETFVFKKDELERLKKIQLEQSK